MTGNDHVADNLRKLRNRIKTLRIKRGHLNYEKFAFQHNMSRLLLRRAELGNNIRYTSLLKIIEALRVSPADFFSEGFE